MFELFSNRARHVLVFAEEEARALRHHYIGTEHELLGLVREKEGVAAKVLVALGLPETRIREAIIRLVGYGEETSHGELPFTPRAKNVVLQANTERAALGDSEVDTEHLLLALLTSDGGVARRILGGVGLEPEIARNEVIRALADRPLRHAAGSRTVLPSEWLTPFAHVLGPLGTEIHETLGRDPDSGDLLLVLACLTELPVARALDELRIDHTTLAAAVQHARGQAAPPPRPSETLSEIRRLLGLTPPAT